MASCFMTTYRKIWEIIKFIMDLLLEGKKMTDAKVMAAAKFKMSASEVERIWRNR